MPFRDWSTSTQQYANSYTPIGVGEIYLRYIFCWPLTLCRLRPTFPSDPWFEAKTLRFHVPRIGAGAPAGSALSTNWLERAIFNSVRPSWWEGKVIKVVAWQSDAMIEVEVWPKYAAEVAAAVMSLTDPRGRSVGASLVEGSGTAAVIRNTPPASPTQDSAARAQSEGGNLV
ncbi:unnamed protein product [Chrysoparadoxa australica]